ncbi:MAG: magnesium-translocating P-type ATPase [Oscillospiraceae bacterium]|nr:magnesium-translocating P-type ATPase [Oscillospiraceae bacterium]
MLESLRKKNKTALETQRLKAEQDLRYYSVVEADVLYDIFHVDERGHDAEVIEDLLDYYGPNEITTDNSNSLLNRIYEAFVNPFNIVLLVISAITFFSDVVFAEDEKNYLTVVIILGLIFISGFIAFVQSHRSNAAAEKLSQMISNKSDVIRDGVQQEIVMEDIVPGDIIRLTAGDMIPADVRFLYTKDTFIAQAALTGESIPVEKYSEAEESDDGTITDLINIGFMGSNIVSGTATAITLATGNETYFGAMAKTLTSNRSKNAFERGVDSVSNLLIRLMLIMIPVVFIVNWITKGDWIQSLLFSVSVAVGLTPEMLPVIMSSTLAKGAVLMSRQSVIVKTLSAIQTFGEMDVLCTDKTGTLTEDKVVLEKYLNVSGDDDSRILRHAYLNSYFQTGLKNLMDLAIINRAISYGYESYLDNYTRLDEIPFDFSRRRMSVVLSDRQGKRQLITKGAVEEMLSISSYVEIEGRVQPLDTKTTAIAMETFQKYNADGLRMIAVAQKNEVPGIETFSVADETDMVLIGFVGFLDPPKESARTAIQALKTHGIRTMVLTGDSEWVAIKVCDRVGVNTESYLTGRDVSAMDDVQLQQAVKSCDLFAKLSPYEKTRVVKALQDNGHTVGFMGDGINDAPPLHQSDVGISVDTAVDIAKETANIILLEKDLMVLEEGVISGRRTFINIIKYIKMAASGNFGNMFSVLIASLFLPFLPMLPLHILIQNLLCDFSQMGIPFDSVDNECIEMPRKWETKSIWAFMSYLGPLSSVFDVLCFVVLWFIIKANMPALAPLFQGGWFLFGTLSQILVIHMIRTSKLPFAKSNASPMLYISTILIAILTAVIGFTPLAVGVEMVALPLSFVPWLILLLVAYCLSTQIIKGIYIKKHDLWL